MLPVRQDYNGRGIRRKSHGDERLIARYADERKVLTLVADGESLSIHTSAY